MSDAIRERIDRTLAARIDAAERAGDEAAAGPLRLQRLANALTGWTYTDPETRAKAAAQQRARRARRRRDNAIRAAVARYEHDLARTMHEEGNADDGASMGAPRHRIPA